MENITKEFVQACNDFSNDSVQNIQEMYITKLDKTLVTAKMAFELKAKIELAELKAKLEPTRTIKSTGIIGINTEVMENTKMLGEEIELIDIMTSELVIRAKKLGIIL